MRGHRPRGSGEKPRPEARAGAIGSLSRYIAHDARRAGDACGERRPIGRVAGLIRVQLHPAPWR